MLFSLFSTRQAHYLSSLSLSNSYCNSPSTIFNPHPLLIYTLIHLFILWENSSMIINHKQLHHLILIICEQMREAWVFNDWRVFIKSLVFIGGSYFLLRLWGWGGFTHGLGLPLEAAFSGILFPISSSSHETIFSYLLLSVVHISSFLHVDEKYVLYPFPYSPASSQPKDEERKARIFNTAIIPALVFQ